MNSTNLLTNKPLEFQFESGKNVIKTQSNIPEPKYVIDIRDSGSKTWSYQCFSLDINIEDNTPYTFSFQAKSSISETLYISFQQQDSPWGEICASYITLSPIWKRYTGILNVKNRLTGSIRFGAVFEHLPHIIEITNFSLYKGIDDYIYPVSTIEEMPIPDKNYLKAAQIDFKIFLLETEIQTHQRIYHFLKKNLSVKSLVTDSQISFLGYFGMYRESEYSDYLDSHNYWHHPVFDEGYEWEQDHYHIPNTAMVNHPFDSSFTWFNLHRVENKPFSISEYDHPFPNQHSQEMFPMLSSFACLQNYDAIYQFDYSLAHQKGDEILQFFGFSIHPGKISMSPIAALVFRKYLIDSSENIVKRILPLDLLRSEMIDEKINPYWFPGYDQSYLYDAIILNKFVPTGSKISKEIYPNTLNATNQWPLKLKQIEWYGDNKTNIYKVNSEKVKMINGFLGKSIQTIGNIKVQMDLLDNETAALALISLDLLPIDNSSKLLLSIVSTVENTNQKWNINKTNTNEGWGNKPVITRFIQFSFSLESYKSIRVHALNPDGESMGILPVIKNGNYYTFNSDFNYPTVSFYIERIEYNQSPTQSATNTKTLLPTQTLDKKPSPLNTIEPSKTIYYNTSPLNTNEPSQSINYNTSPLNTNEPSQSINYNTSPLNTNEPTNSINSTNSNHLITDNNFQNVILSLISKHFYLSISIVFLSILIISLIIYSIISCKNEEEDDTIFSPISI